MDFVTSEELLFPQNTPEPPLPSALLDLEYLYGLFLETPSDTGSAQGIPSSSSRSLHDAPEPSNFSPQVVTPVDEGTSLWTACSTSTSTPQSQVSTFPPLNWRKIPQKSYDHGQKQWDFRASTPISFTVNGFPGVNMRDALNGNFTDLDGRDEPVLQNAPGSAISCRLSVRSSLQLPPCLRVDPISSFPDIRPINHPRYGCSSRSCYRIFTVITDFYTVLGQETRSNKTQQARTTGCQESRAVLELDDREFLLP